MVENFTVIREPLSAFAIMCLFSVATVSHAVMMLAYTFEQMRTFASSL